MGQELQQELEGAAVQLYRSLSACVATHTDIIIPILQSSACVWTGSGFEDAGVVVMASAVDFKPYLFSLPQASLAFRDLLMMLGVRRSPSVPASCETELALRDLLIMLGVCSPLCVPAACKAAVSAGKVQADVSRSLKKAHA